MAAAVRAGTAEAVRPGDAIAGGVPITLGGNDAEARTVGPGVDGGGRTTGTDGIGVGTGVGTAVGTAVGTGVGLGVALGVGVTGGPVTTTMGGTPRSEPAPAQSLRANAFAAHASEPALRAPLRQRVPATAPTWLARQPPR